MMTVHAFVVHYTALGILENENICICAADSATVQREINGGRFIMFSSQVYLLNAVTKKKRP